MTLLRQVVPGRDYMITRRCSERRFFLRPDEDTDNAFIYCLALAAKRANVQVTFAVALSNHHHAGIHDPYGNSLSSPSISTDFSPSISNRPARSSCRLPARGQFYCFMDPGTL